MEPAVDSARTNGLEVEASFAARARAHGGPEPGCDPGPAAQVRPRERTPERAAHRLYVQIAWSTVDRLPLIAPEARGPAEARLISLCRRLDVDPVAVRVSAAGVALLVRVTPSHAIGTIATALKLGSEDALVASGRPVRWSRGFAASSVAPTDVRRRARRLRPPEPAAAPALRSTPDRRPIPTGTPAP